LSFSVSLVALRSTCGCDITKVIIIKKNPKALFIAGFAAPALSGDA
jgi:hypothetical protein